MTHTCVCVRVRACVRACVPVCAHAHHAAHALRAHTVYVHTLRPGGAEPAGEARPCVVVWRIAAPGDAGARARPMVHFGAAQQRFLSRHDIKQEQLNNGFFLIMMYECAVDIPGAVRHAGGFGWLEDELICSIHQFVFDSPPVHHTPCEFPSRVSPNLALRCMRPGWLTRMIDSAS